jgi:succinate-semialdehyde dehydrogenase/glutarate-semialdehyde dehydrogenase
MKAPRWGRSSKDALETLSKQVDEAVKNGATLHLGGKAVAGRQLL